MKRLPETKTMTAKDLYRVRRSKGLRGQGERKTTKYVNPPTIAHRIRVRASQSPVA